MNQPAATNDDIINVIGDSTALIDKRFRRVDERFKTVDKCFEGLESEAMQTNFRLGGLTKTVNNIDRRPESVEGEIVAIHSDQRELYIH